MKRIARILAIFFIVFLMPLFGGGSSGWTFEKPERIVNFKKDKKSTTSERDVKAFQKKASTSIKRNVKAFQRKAKTSQQRDVRAFQRTTSVTQSRDVSAFQRKATPVPTRDVRSFQRNVTPIPTRDVRSFERKVTPLPTRDVRSFQREAPRFPVRDVSAFERISSPGGSGESTTGGQGDSGTPSDGGVSDQGTGSKPNRSQQYREAFEPENYRERFQSENYRSNRSPYGFTNQQLRSGFRYRSRYYPNGRYARDTNPSLEPDDGDRDYLTGDQSQTDTSGAETQSQSRVYWKPPTPQWMMDYNRLPPKNTGNQPLQIPQYIPPLNGQYGAPQTTPSDKEQADEDQPADTPPPDLQKGDKIDESALDSAKDNSEEADSRAAAQSSNNAESNAQTLSAKDELELGKSLTPAQRLARSGDSMFERRLYYKAISQYESAMIHDPDDQDIAIRAALSQFAARKYTTAGGTLRKAMGETPDSNRISKIARELYPSAKEFNQHLSRFSLRRKSNSDSNMDYLDRALSQVHISGDEEK